MEFEWDPLKAEANLKKHGVSFNEATMVFNDPNAIEELDAKHSSRTEMRFTMIGMASVKLLLVVYTERLSDRIRIISARRVTRSERSIYEQANS